MRYILNILFSLILVLVLGAYSGGEVSVLLMEKTSIAGQDVLMGDIASIKSSEEELASALRKIIICSAAEPGFSQTLNVSYIKSRIQQQGMSPESISWGGSKQVVIETKSQILTPQEIQDYAKKFVLKTLCSKLHTEISELEPSVQVRLVNEIRPVVLPYGEVVVNVESASVPSSKGVLYLRFVISVDGRECENRMILFRVDVYKEVLVAVHALERHQMIAKDDLHLVLKNIGASFDVFSQKDDIVGKRARRMISSGTIITENMVEDPPIIDKGDLVTIIIESEAFRIMTQGKAQESGARSQIIRVVNTSSMKEITAQVVSEKVVRVLFMAQ